MSYHLFTRVALAAFAAALVGLVYWVSSQTLFAASEAAEPSVEGRIHLTASDHPEQQPPAPADPTQLTQALSVAETPEQPSDAPEAKTEAVPAPMTDSALPAPTPVESTTPASTVAR